MFWLEVLRFWNPFWLGDLHLLCLKNDCSNFKAVKLLFLSHTNTKIPISAHGYFFSLPQSFCMFFFDQIHRARLFFWFLGTQGSTIPLSVLYMNFYFSQEHHKIEQITVFKSFIISFSVYEELKNEL